MNDTLPLIFALLAGIILGLIYFLGLWETVRRLPQARRPILWMLASLILRLAFILAGLYLIGHGHWDRLIAALIGILIVRTILVRRIRPQDRPSTAVNRHHEGQSP